MGYYTSINGTITLSRELNHFETTTLLVKDMYGVYLQPAEISKIETPEGVFHKRVTKYVDFELEGKNYGFEEEFRNFIAELPADVTANGYVQGEGEEQGDVWRLYVKGREVRRVAAKLVWPEVAE